VSEVRLHRINSYNVLIHQEIWKRENRKYPCRWIQFQPFQLCMPTLPIDHPKDRGEFPSIVELVVERWHLPSEKWPATKIAPAMWTSRRSARLRVRGCRAAGQTPRRCARCSAWSPRESALCNRASEIQLKEFILDTPESGPDWF
jgi:hypothetical protein